MRLIVPDNVCDNRVAAVDLPFQNALSATPRSSLCYPAVDPHQSFIGRVRIGFSVRSIRGIRLEVSALHAPHGSYTDSD